MRLFLGLDVGGTRTRCLVAGEDGQALGYAETGPGSHEIVGWDGLRAALSAATTQALAKAGASIADMAAVGAGVAGYDWPSEREPTLAALSTLGARCPVALRNDSALGLAAVADEGVNLCAGTSNNCYGYWNGREGGLAGASLLAGEEGGATEMAMLALRAVNHARILRSPPTMLSRLIPESAGLAGPDALVEAVAKGRLSPSPGWAPLVFAAAREGDEAALGIIERSGEELGRSAVAVMRQLGLVRALGVLGSSEPIELVGLPLVLSGSLFSLEPALAPAVERTVSAVARGVRLVRLEAPPVVGAVALAMTAIGANASDARCRLARTAVELSGARS